MANSLPVTTVDLQAKAMDIASRLGSLIHFLEAASELLTCRNLTTTSFERYSKKIVALVEIARQTLATAGIALYLFSTCPTASAPYKKAYIDLLHMLKDRRHEVHATLKERVRSLLQPLSPNFQIIRSGDDNALKIPHFAPAARTQAPKATLNLQTTQYSSPMPPPDAFCAIGTSIFCDNGRSAARGRRLWNVETPAPRHYIPRALSFDEENTAPHLLLRPLSRRFGIFCTGKTTMHQYREHPRAIRPLKE